MSMRDEAWFEYLNEKNIGFNPYNTYELVVEIKREKGVKLPKFATNGSAGIDLIANIETPITLNPNDCILIPSGISISIKNKDYCGLIYPRSGLGHKHGIILGNSVGVIDSDYQGEIKLSLFNRGKQPFIIKPKIRLAQMVFTRIMQPYFVPYIGYWQLMNAVDKYVIYDDVNFIVELKHFPSLYNKIMKDVKRSANIISKKIK